MKNEKYFFGNEDRKMDGSSYGIGDFIYIKGKMHPIDRIEHTEAVTSVFTKCGKKFDVIDEPSHELFMEVLGTPWDTRWREYWLDDDDYSDFVPYTYKSRAAFANGEHELYHR